jgi:hypothetical protein
MGSPGIAEIARYRRDRKQGQASGHHEPLQDEESARKLAFAPKQPLIGALPHFAARRVNFRLLGLQAKTCYLADASKVRRVFDN